MTFFAQKWILGTNSVRNSCAPCLQTQNLEQKRSKWGKMGYFRSRVGASVGDNNVFLFESKFISSIFLSDFRSILNNIGPSETSPEARNYNMIVEFRGGVTPQGEEVYLGVCYGWQRQIICTNDGK